MHPHQFPVHPSLSNSYHVQPVPAEEPEARCLAPFALSPSLAEE